ncbi:MAG: Ldh family oxidoreductase [bacterium]|nr:Ldh family oxidoreductase [bacterium]
MWKVSPTRLEDTCTAIVRATGAPGADARLVAEHLVENDVIGHHSHGVIRLWDYIEWTHSGDLIPGARPRILGETPTTARVDGGWNFGQVVATFATGLAIEKARTAGVGVVTIRRVKHIGRLGRYAEQVAGEGLVSMIFTNGGGHGINQAPFRGTERKLCSNPIAMSVPSRLAGPFLLDMATSVAAEGKVRVYRARGTPTPTGWILDSDGNPTTDPEDFARGGALLPLGRDEGHKGYALAFMVELLAGVMSGGGISGDPGRSFSNDSMIIVIDPELFVPMAELEERSLTLTEHLKDTRLADESQPVLYPGEMEAEARLANRERDIELPDPVRQQLLTMLRRFSLPEAKFASSG